MKPLSPLTLILFFSLIFFSYQSSSAQKTCNCIANLDTLIKKTEQNYAGYPDMIQHGRQEQYKQLVTKLKTQAASLSDPQQCFKMLKAYVNFFNDRHFDLEYSISDSTRYQYIRLSEPTFIAGFNKKKRDPIEGIWLNPDSSLKLAVYKKDAQTYQAVILESKDKKLKPGLVYYTMTNTKKGLVFDRYDWGTPDFPVRQRGNLLYIWNFDLWAKTFPNSVSHDESTVIKTWRDNNYGLDCKKLDDNNVLLTIASFNRDDKIKKKIQENDSLIRSAKHLIVDLRGNGGGNSGWVYLMPYFATKPISQGATYLRLSPDNIRMAMPGIKSTFETPVTDPALKKSFSPEVLDAFRKAHQEIPNSKEPFYKLPSITVHPETTFATPEKVALIFDDLCGSSTEFFFYLSQQSDKVIRYGERTIGMMDYMGVSNDTKLPFSDYYLLIPDHKSAWTDQAPKNITGFIPERNLRRLPRSQWISFIREDLNK